MSVKSDKLFLRKADGLTCAESQIGITKMIEITLLHANIGFLNSSLYRNYRQNIRYYAAEYQSSGAYTL